MNLIPNGWFLSIKKQFWLETGLIPIHSSQWFSFALVITGIFAGVLITISMKLIKDQIKIMTGKQFTDKIRNIQQKKIKETHRLQSSIFYWLGEIIWSDHWLINTLSSLIYEHLWTFHHPFRAIKQMDGMCIFKINEHTCL